MKMETHVTADRNAEVQQLLVAPATACRRRN
jgi:biotin carboxyl carrier protein